MSTSKYPPALRVLHWLMGILIIGMLCVGFYMANIPSDAPNKYSLYPWHKSFGLIVMLLVLIRLPVRWRGPLPDQAPGLQVWEHKLSKVVHVLLYAAMLLMTFSGYLMSSFHPQIDGIDMFGWFKVPDVTGKDKALSGAMHELHEIVAVLFCILLVLHIGGVIKHRLLDGPGKDVLPRML